MELTTWPHQQQDDDEFPHPAVGYTTANARSASTNIVTPDYGTRKDEIFEDCSVQFKNLEGTSMQSRTDNNHCGDGELKKMRESMAFIVAAVGMIIYIALIAFNQYNGYAFTLITTSSVCCFLMIPMSMFKDKRGRLKQRQRQRERQRQRQRQQQAKYPTLAGTYISMMCQQIQQRFFFRGGDVNLTVVSLIFIAIPCLVNISHGFLKHIDGSWNFTQATHKHLANDFGKMAVSAMSFFLIPVSRQSVLLVCLQISPSHAVKLHTFAGYIALGSGLSHGLYWLWIWFFLKHETIATILPGVDCWHWGDQGEDCQDQFVSALGILCGISFVLLGLSSMRWVRRNHYRVFYVCHVVFSLILLFGLVMHYNKMIWYLAPSVIYYFASSTPVMVNALQKWIDGGTLIMNAVEIPNSRGCVEMTMKYSDSHLSMDVLRLTCGSHVRISVPEISKIWHPFTVFSSASTPEELKLLFRPTGPFTSGLSKRLIGDSGRQYPKVLVDGMYGSPSQLRHVLCHETVLIVAGGVGIVSYISLLKSILSNQDFDDVDQHVDDSLTKQIILHWICRDVGLIKHIVDEYLDECGACGRPPIQIVIHHTNKEDLDMAIEERCITDGNALTSDDFVDHERIWQGKPFTPTMPWNNTKNALLFLVNFLTILWGGLWLMHYFYGNVQSKQIVYTRSLVIFAIMSLSVVSSVLTALGIRLLSCSETKSYNIVESPSINSLSDTGTDLTSDTGMTTEQCRVQIEHCRGRPSTHEIVERALDSSDNVGIFLCGPTSLHQTIRSFVEKKERHLCRSQKVSFYEEVFEL